MIRRLLFIHLCLVTVTVNAVGDCSSTPPLPNKSIPANISGGLLHFTQVTSPDANYNPYYVLEVTNFDLDTPRKAFAQYAGPKITSEAVCNSQTIYLGVWYFNQNDGCWHNGGSGGNTGFWKTGNYCLLYREVGIPTKIDNGTPSGIPLHITKVRVEVAAPRGVKWGKKTLILNQQVKAGVISF